MRKLLKPNTVLNLANALKTLLQDLLLCDLINVLARFEKYSLKNIHFQKYSQGLKDIQLQKFLIYFLLEV